MRKEGPAQRGWTSALQIADCKIADRGSPSGHEHQLVDRLSGFKANTNDPMNKFYICGGQFRSSVFQKLEEWESCKRAMLVEIDPVTKTSRSCLEYESPKEVTADELPAILFKYATARDNQLYTCTSTEILIYDLPSFRLMTYISLPIFNDLHHVYPTPQGTLLVAITGLDIVAEVSLDGQFLRH